MNKTNINNREDEIPDIKSGDEDFSNSVSEDESPDVSGFNELSEPY